MTTYVLHVGSRAINSEEAVKEVEAALRREFGTHRFEVVCDDDSFLEWGEEYTGGDRAGYDVAIDYRHVGVIYSFDERNEHANDVAAWAQGVLLMNALVGDRNCGVTLWATCRGDDHHEPFAVSLLDDFGCTLGPNGAHTGDELGWRYARA